MRCFLGVDVGGTKTAAAVVDACGRVLLSSVVATPARLGGAAVLEAAGAGAALTLERARAEGLRPEACGAGVAGVIGPDGVVTSATEALPGWAGVDVRSGLAAATGLPVRVVNDVHALALGEARFGAAADARSVLVVAVGTGVGGAFVHDRRLVAGRSGTAGSIGHTPVAGREGRRCPCGAEDHLEAYASGPAIVSRYAARGGQGERLEDVVAAAGRGDDAARTVLVEAGTLIGQVVAGAANLLDPHAIVLGGGVLHAGAHLLDPLRRALMAHTLPGPRAAPVSATAPLPHGNVVGAASLVMDGIDL